MCHATEQVQTDTLQTRCFDHESQPSHNTPVKHTHNRCMSLTNRKVPSYWRCMLFAIYSHKNEFFSTLKLVEGLITAAVRFQRTSNASSLRGPPPVYRTLGPRVKLKMLVRHFAHPFPNFAKRVKVSK